MPWTREVTYLSGQTDFQMLQLPGYKRQRTAGLSAEGRRHAIPGGMRLPGAQIQCIAGPQTGEETFQTHKNEETEQGGQGRKR